jgi:hypothetical protein
MLAFFVLGMVAFAVLAFLGRSSSQVFGWITSVLRASIGLLYYLAGELQMPSPSDFVTQVVANAVAVLIIGVMNLIVLRRVIKEPEPPEPDIDIRHGYTIAMKDKSTVFMLSIYNEGDTAALSCQARITFDSLERKDLLEIPNIKSHINSENFDYIALNRSTLPWVSFPLFSSPKDFVLAEKTDIIAGDDAQLGILKIVPAQCGIPEHFEIPSAVKGEAIACLRVKRLYGKLKVTPQNGEPETSNFEIAHRAFSREWHLSLG